MTRAIDAIDLLARAPYGRIAASRQALPFVTVARHIVEDGAVLLRLHKGFGYHDACDGSVVAYEADNIDRGGDEVWCVQFVGTARLITLTAKQLERFGPLSHTADGAPFDPAYLRVDPQHIQLRWLTGVPRAEDLPSGDLPAATVSNPDGEGLGAPPSPPGLGEE